MPVPYRDFAAFLRRIPSVGGVNNTSLIRISALAALSLVAFTTTATASRSPKPLGIGHQELSAGVHVLDLVSRERPGAGGPKHLPRIAITLPPGWFNYDGWGLNDTDGLSISFWDVDEVYGTPCRWQSKPKVDPGPTVSGLASALAAQPLRHASVPRDVVLGGFRGKYLSWSEPKAPLACDQGSSRAGRRRDGRATATSRGRARSTGSGSST